MKQKTPSCLTGYVLEDQEPLSLADLCRACMVHAEQVIELVDEGVIEPIGRDNPAHWRFHGANLRRMRVALNLQRDLGVNVAGVALALDLLDEMEQLRNRLQAHHW